MILIYLLEIAYGHVHQCYQKVAQNSEFNFGKICYILKYCVLTSFWGKNEKQKLTFRNTDISD